MSGNGFSHLPFFEEDGETVYEIEVTVIQPTHLMARTLNRKPNLILLVQPRFSPSLRDLAELAEVAVVGRRGHCQIRLNTQNGRPLAVAVELNPN